MTKDKILIIEDDIFLAEVLINKLVAAGFETDLAVNGKDGLDKIKSLKPTLVLLDIILPVMNGYQILEAKIKDSEIKDIPVIVVSNSGQPVEVKRALALGVKGYLIKADIDPDEAVSKVKEEIEKMKLPKDDMAKTVNFTKGGVLSGKKILWVEDDRFLKDIITVRLSNEGCQLMHAGDESEAMAYIAKVKPDIILLDILLPGSDGFEILKKIKLINELKDVPVVMLSNLSQKADIEKGNQLGAIKFLVKSTVTLDEIIDEIRNVLNATK